MTVTAVPLRARAATRAAGFGASTADIDVYQGDDTVVLVSFFDSTGNPIDPNLWTWRAQIRRVSADDDKGAAALATFSTSITAGAPTAGAASWDTDPWDLSDWVSSGGQLRLFLPHATTTVLKGGDYRWDLEGTRVSDGWVTTYLHGGVRVTAEVTR